MARMEEVRAFFEPRKGKTPMRQVMRVSLCYQLREKEVSLLTVAVYALTTNRAH